jgi:predicted amidophosphoribosyltransferase
MMKYERIEPLGAWFAKRLPEVVRREPPQFAADLIVPVPLHRMRQKARVQPSGPFWTAAGAETRVALPTSFAEAGTGSPGEHLLHFEERWETVRGAFVIREGGRVDNLRILLLDDVMTSGATLDACSRALREAGAKSVAGLTIARAVRQGFPVRESF